MTCIVIASEIGRIPFLSDENKRSMHASKRWLEWVMEKMNSKIFNRELILQCYRVDERLWDTSRISSLRKTCCWFDQQTPGGTNLLFHLRGGALNEIDAYDQKWLVYMLFTLANYSLWQKTRISVAISYCHNLRHHRHHHRTNGRPRNHISDRSKVARTKSLPKMVAMRLHVHWFSPNPMVSHYIATH